MKGIVYKNCIRNAMRYEAEYTISWAVRVEHIIWLGTTEMRMLLMICGKILKDKMRSECIRGISRVESIMKVMESQRPRWYGHVERMTEGKAPIIARKILVHEKKIGRPKKRWIGLVTEDINKRKSERS